MANKPQANLVYYKGYGANFKKLRIEKGLKQEELADIIHISDKTISSIETEKREPTIEQINIYRKYFNVSLDYLTGATNISNTTIQYISDYTGLSEKAIERLKYIASNNVVSFDTKFKAFYLPNDKLNLRIQAINKLIESEEFAQLIDNLTYIERLTNDILPCESDNHVQCAKNTQLESSSDICRYNVFKTNEKICNLFDRREN